MLLKALYWAPSELPYAVGCCDHWLRLLDEIGERSGQSGQPLIYQWMVYIYQGNSPIKNERKSSRRDKCLVKIEKRWATTSTTITHAQTLKWENLLKANQRRHGNCLSPSCSPASAEKRWRGDWWLLQPKRKRKWMARCNALKLPGPDRTGKKHQHFQAQGRVRKKIRKCCIRSEDSKLVCRLERTIIHISPIQGHQRNLQVNSVGKDLDLNLCSIVMWRLATLLFSGKSTVLFMTSFFSVIPISIRPGMPKSFLPSEAKCWIRS